MSVLIILCECECECFNFAQHGYLYPPDIVLLFIYFISYTAQDASCRLYDILAGECTSAVISRRAGCSIFTSDWGNPDNHPRRMFNVDNYQYRRFIARSTAKVNNSGFFSIHMESSGKFLINFLINLTSSLFFQVFSMVSQGFLSKFSGSWDLPTYCWSSACEGI